jgi:hypothetical protein
VIVHGDLRPETVTFTPADVPGDDPRDVKLSGLCSAVVGSPLLDIYAVVFNCANPGNTLCSSIDSSDLLDTTTSEF